MCILVRNNFLLFICSVRVFALIGQFMAFPAIIVTGARGRIGKDGRIAANWIIAEGVAPHALFLPNGLVLVVDGAFDGAFHFIVALTVESHDGFVGSAVSIVVIVSVGNCR